jgi:Yip1 domain
MFDIDATIKWISAVLKTPAEVAPQYKAISAPFLQTFLQIVLPAFVGSYLIGGMLGWLLGSSSGPGGLSFMAFVMGLLFGLGWTFVVAFVFDFFAGTFGGVKNYDHAYATVGLAIVPACAGAILGPLPWIGWLLSIAASIYSLVLAWRFIPEFLAVPEDSRVKHYAASVGTLFVAGFIVMIMWGMVFTAASVTSAVLSGGDTEDSAEAVENIFENGKSTGVLGGMERSGQLLEQAEQDVYEPPDDGELTEEQVETYISTLKKTKALRERIAKKYEEFDEEEGKEPSLTDIFGGIGDMTRAGSAEVEVVKTAGGNWKEHLWVKNAIETARVQQDINDAVAHNYALFQQYQEDIEAFD